MKNPELLTPTAWKDYELIDSGGFEKLERFGKWVTARPEPQAIWKKSLPAGEWERLAHAVFRRTGASEERGEWRTARNMPEQWWVEYSYKKMRLKMRLGLTSFKHVGIFPEQAENWNFIYDRCKRIEELKGSPANVLNLFAYTGGATLAARSAGAAVTHVDSVKQVVGWARENMEASGLDGVRWIVDDALKFARRELKRGKRYEGIILDPPAYGRGPDGEKWVLEQNIGELLEICAELLAPRNSFLVLNLYSMGLSALLAKGTCNQLFGKPGSSEADNEDSNPCPDTTGGRSNGGCGKAPAGRESAGGVSTDGVSNIEPRRAGSPAGEPYLSGTANGGTGCGTGRESADVTRGVSKGESFSAGGTGEESGCATKGALTGEPRSTVAGGVSKGEPCFNVATKGETHEVSHGESSPGGEEHFGELYFSDRAGKALPLGVFYRLTR